MSDEVPASVAQVSPVSDHPHLTRMQEAIAEEVSRQGGGGGNMSDLERRVGILETDVRAIRDNLNTLVTDTAVIKSNYASKTDISDLKTDIADLKTEIKTDISSIKAEIASANLVQTRWMIGILLAAIGLVFAIQRYSPPQSSLVPSQAQAISNQIPANISPPVQQRTP
ncbi:MAG: hypothetical protein PSU93_00450 [Methylobacter sp.]|uniref:DUF1640 domain-containing protein n=1 Tax=Candidatus Methylobacter titanis TaxID=3053457 RepID=A0AA43Q2M2_9GAMM|nr:hypothetical protein [Candidatus Methylobacter titanis]